MSACTHRRTKALFLTINGDPVRYCQDCRKMTTHGAPILARRSFMDVLEDWIRYSPDALWAWMIVGTVALFILGAFMAGR